VIKNILFIGLILLFVMGLIGFSNADPTIQPGPSDSLIWTPPTTNTDGSVLLDSGIGGYKMYWCVQTGTAVCTNFGDPNSSDVAKPTGNTILISATAAPKGTATLCFQATAYATTTKYESGYSNRVCGKKNPAPFTIPSSPGTLQ
jgi:hypothetical protein